MEVIKELPEVFEEFAEQRKNSFLAMKQLKDKESVAGAYCTYFPKEIATAMGQRQLDYVPHQMRRLQRQRKIFRKTYVR